MAQTPQSAATAISSAQQQLAAHQQQQPLQHQPPPTRKPPPPKVRLTQNAVKKRAHSRGSSLGLKNWGGIG